MEAILGLGGAGYDAAQSKDVVRKFQRLAFPAINPYTAECSYFADCILRNEPPAINGAAGALRNMALIEKAYQSSQTRTREKDMTSRLATVAARWAALLLCAAVPGQSPAGAMDIVKSGRPVATIIVPGYAPAGRGGCGRRTAISPPQGHRREARSGQGERRPGAGSEIVLGATRAAAESGLLVSRARPNAFRIKLVGQSLFILGDDSDGPVFGIQQNNRTRVGTLFGAYEFIEKRLGVRWLWPGELGEVIPPLRDVVVEQWDQMGRPAFIHTRWRDGAVMTAAPEGWSSAEARAKYLHAESVWLRRHRFAMGAEHGHGPFVHQLVGPLLEKSSGVFQSAPGWNAPQRSHLLRRA